MDKRSDAHVGLLIPLLAFVLTKSGTQEALARLLKVSPPFIAQVKAGTATFSKEKRLLLLKELNKRLDGAQFTEQHLQLPINEFVKQVPANHPLRSDIYAFAGLQPSARANGDTKRLAGKFIRLYVCGMPGNTKKKAVAIDDFEFQAAETSAALKVTQNTYDHAPNQPTGTLEVVGRTIQMLVRYPGDEDPIGQLIAPMPGTTEVNLFVGVALDIKAQSRDPFARPMIFVRADSFFPNSRLYREGTGIFRATIACLNEMVEFYPDKFEVVPRLTAVGIHYEELSRSLDFLRRAEAARRKRDNPAN